jgi:hypothetical protein
VQRVKAVLQDAVSTNINCVVCLYDVACDLCLLFTGIELYRNARADSFMTLEL